ncbi:MAG: ammonia-forming cytochrome c nitrite reductase subunit c552 [Thermoplasmata archaeon]|nr:ammonia-forming cytochrome c nitrite reductase subunit c552 [Candidatus Thermoplasmatota archaeon]MCK4948537.1 ammonia-forming cytochrome c nitrite reductase subunit c552 [Thermoplasmata archaeon]
MAPIDKKRLLLGILPLVFVAVLLAVLLQLTAVADETGTRSPGSYVGSDACQPCHETSHAGWAATNHPSAWVTLNNDSSKIEECEKCHVTGWGDEGHGGFNPTSDTPVEMRGIQCEACHGPGSDHLNTSQPQDIQVSLSAVVCGATCHQKEHHPYFQEWEESGHAMSLISLRGATGAAEDSCLECHSADYILANESEKPTLETAEYPITCALCHDPHNGTNPNQLRWPVEELCAKCHNPTGAIPGDPIYHPQSSMRDGRSGAPILGDSFMPGVECSDCHVYMYWPSNVTGHSFTQKPEACVVCHSTVQPVFSNDTAQTQVSQWRTQTWSRIIEVQQVVVLSARAIEDAADYGFSDGTVEIAIDLHNEANYSLAFIVADGSGGSHNPPFASSLLNFSEDRSNELISLLTPGTISGRVVDTMGNPVEGVTVEKDGRVWATSRSNGTFQFLFAPGTHSFNLKLRGSSVGGIDSVTVLGDAVSEVGDVEIVEENIIIPMIIAIVAIILLSLIVAYLLFKKRGKGSEGEDSSPQNDLGDGR